MKTIQIQVETAKQKKLLLDLADQSGLKVNPVNRANKLTTKDIIKGIARKATDTQIADFFESHSFEGKVNPENLLEEIEKQAGKLDKK